MLEKFVIDMSKFPSSGRDFLLLLRSGHFYIPIISKEIARTGFPKFLVAPYAIAGNNLPNLINIWCFENEEKNAYVIGGVAGPTRQPARDWKLFEQYLDTIEDPEQYKTVLALLNNALVKFFMENPRHL